MAIVEKTFAIDELVAERLNQMVADNKQSGYINDLILADIYQMDRQAVSDKLAFLRKNRKQPTGIISTEMLYRMRTGDNNA